MLLRIEKHLARTGSQPTSFGCHANGNFFFALRRGHEPRPATGDRVAAWFDRAEASAR
jgi:hypothetical protein